MLATDINTIEFSSTLGIQTIRSNEFVTYRRALLDMLLSQVSPFITGLVVDLGGKKEKKRGAFTPPLSQVAAWHYLNLTPESSPDVLCDATKVPVQSASADCVMCTETIEHLEDPRECIKEAYRILKPGGLLILSVPFLYPVHGDPYDFSRLTDHGLRALLRTFSSVRVLTMGAFWGVLSILSQIYSEKSKNRLTSGTMRRLSKLFAWIDSWNLDPNRIESFTTGYFCICRK